MSDLLKWDKVAADTAQRECDRLAEEIDGVYRNLCNCRNQLEAVCAGLTIDNFCQFVEGPGKQNVAQLAEMCRETAAALRHTTEQFGSADQQLSGTFRG